MNSSILTTTLNLFLDLFKGIPNNLKNTALGLACSFTIIDLLWTYYKEVLEIDWIKYLVRRALTVGLMVWIITSYPTLVNTVKDGFLKISDIAITSGGNSEFMENPSLLFERAINLCSVITDSTGFWAVSDRIINFFIKGFIYVFTLIICFQIIITVLEFYFLSGLALIFIPFGLLGAGASYFSNALKTIVACSIKLMVINLILKVSNSTLLGLTLTPAGNTGFETLVVIIATIALIAYLVLKIPAMASSLLTGSPALNGNDIAKMVASAAKTAVMVAAAAASGGAAGAISTIKDGGGGFKALGNALSGAAAGAGNEIKHNIFGGGSSGTLERGAKGKEELGSLFSSAGSSKKDSSSSGGNDSGGSTANISSNATNNSSATVNSSGKSENSGKSEGGESKNNSTQNDSNNASMATAASAMSALAANDKPNIFNGKDGTQGLSGTKGNDGRDGFQGETGEKGEHGLNGNAGSNGAQGETGEKGESKNNIHSSQIASANSPDTGKTESDTPRKTLLNGSELKDEDK